MVGVRLISLVFAILRDLCTVLVPGLSQAGESLSCPICQHGWTVSISHGSRDYVLVTRCQTEVLLCHA